MATLQNTDIDTTGFLKVPVGTVAQRPAPGSAETGMIRICTDFPGFTAPVLEYYDGTEWKSLYTATAVGIGGTETSDVTYTYHAYTTVGSSTFEVVLE